MPNFSSILFSLCLFPIRKTIAIDDENTCVERPQMCARRTKWEVVEYIASSLPHTHFKWHSLDSHSLSSNSYSKGKIGCVVEMENVRGSEWESSELKEREREKNFNNTRGASQVAVKSVCCCCCCWWWDFSSYLHKFASSFFLHVVIISNALCSCKVEKLIIFYIFFLVDHKCTFSNDNDNWGTEWRNFSSSVKFLWY